MRNFLRWTCTLSMAMALMTIPYEIYGQVRRTHNESENSSRTTGETRRTTTTPVRRNDSQVRRTEQTRRNDSQVRRTEQTRRNDSQVRRTEQTRRNDSQVHRTDTPVRRTESGSSEDRVIRSNSNITQNGLGSYDSRGNATTHMYHRGDDYYIRDNRYDDDDYYDYRLRDHNLYRVPPIERAFMRSDRISYFYGDARCFGWRVETLPVMCSRVTYFGVEYYTYRNVYYRRYRGHYVVCRPPFGITIETSLGRHHFTTVRFSYYPSQYRRYRGYDSYSSYIDRQNRVIARNNAIIASQNRMIALNSSAAASSYEIANRLGLVQSYAYADREYYYQDGVFYIINSRGRYEVIPPPAGALVDRLPEDYEVIVLGGAEYYRVDDTVYRTVLVYGVPQLEVLGQMYGQLARRYNRYDGMDDLYDRYDHHDDDWDDWDD